MSLWGIRYLRANSLMPCITDTALLSVMMSVARRMLTVYEGFPLARA